ncbi:MAG: class I SAM-dependent methyltransferase [Ignavibacteria bacterium]|nr:class I SAM-dependent methyltransferase [Ignavibacteria bacterium]
MKYFSKSNIYDKNHVTNAWGNVFKNNRNFYQTSYPKYLSRLKHQDFMKLLESLIPNSSEKKIIELGCGRGIDSLYLAFMGYKVTAFDYYEIPLRNLKNAKENYEMTLRRPLELDIIQGDFFNTGFSDETFDVVFNSGVIEHYSNENYRIELLSEMNRITKKGGYTVVAFPNKLHPLVNIWEFLRNKFSNFEIYELPEFEISPDEIELEMKKSNFDDITVKGIDLYNSICYYPQWRVLRLLSYILRVLVPTSPVSLSFRLGTRLVCIGKK